MIQDKNNGFSLVELLVAIAISMVAMIAITQSYASTRQTARLQGMQSRLTEDGHFALSMIQRIFTQAGFRVAPSSNLAADRFAVAGNVATVKFESDGANQIVCNGTVPALGGGVQTVQISRSGNSLTCVTGSGASASTENWIAPASSGRGNSTEVLAFTVQMGIDTGPNPTDADYSCGAGTRDCIADSYVNDLTGAQTASQVVAAKVCLLLRSEATDGSVVKEADVSDCSGGTIANSRSDQHLYRMFRTTVLLRNR